MSTMVRPERFELSKLSVLGRATLPFAHGRAIIYQILRYCTNGNRTQSFGVTLPSASGEEKPFSFLYEDFAIIAAIFPSYWPA